MPSNGIWTDLVTAGKLRRMEQDGTRPASPLNDDGHAPGVAHPSADASATTSVASGKRSVADSSVEMDDRMAKVMRVEATVKHGTKTKQEDLTSQFTKALIGREGAPGILKPGKTPYPHQRKFVKRVILDDVQRILMLHDPGTGKTFTFFLTVAARHIITRGRRQKVIVSVPASCLTQWYNAVLETLSIPKSRILSTNRQDKLTKETLAKHDFIIVTKETIGRAWNSCHEWVQAHHRNERGNWVSQWDRKPGVELHPLFTVEYTLFGIDELHFMRNSITGWTKGHELVSKNARKVIGCTATPVFNKPDDLIGLSTAMDLPKEWKEWPKWFKDRKRTCVNTDTITEFNTKYVDRVTDDILNLPPITHEVVNFQVVVNPDSVADYNDVLANARRLRFSIERNGGRATAQEMNKLMAYLQTLQQFLVSPMLAERGASEMQKDQELIRKASASDTGALVALRNTLLKLHGEGLDRIMVAACHTSLLKIAMEYLKRTTPETGDIILYTGELSQNQRSDVVRRFLTGTRTVMLMSIDAGGTGLHLVPGSNAAIFWGSRPFSPMQVLQTSKRIHRIGQDFPVKITHLIAEGSVDYAINMVHGDKLSLSKAVIDHDMSTLERQGGRWRSTGRIVDACKFLSEDGSFTEDEISEDHAMSSVNAYRASRSAGNPRSPDDLYAAKAPPPHSNGIYDLMMDLPPLPAPIAQALVAQSVNLSTGLLQAAGLQI